MPADAEQRDVIDRVAKYVAKDGAGLESVLRERERGNPLFDFITPVRLLPGGAGGGGGADGGGDVAAAAAAALHAYYRWRVYALLMGDEDEWRTSPFQMVAGHNTWWVPPPCPAGAVEARRAAKEARRAAKGERHERGEPPAGA